MVCKYMSCGLLRLDSGRVSSPEKIPGRFVSRVEFAEVLKHQDIAKMASISQQL